MQQTLIPQKKPEEVHEAAKNAPVETERGDTNSMWRGIHDWLESCEKQKENFAYMTVEYRATVAVNGTKEEYVTTTVTLERPFKPEGDSYGGMWGWDGNYRQTELNQLKKALIDWRNSLLGVPYCKEKADGAALRDIKKENIRVFFDESAEEFVARCAVWTVAQLQQELNSLQEAPLTQEYLDKFEKMKFLDKEIRKMEYELLPRIRNDAGKEFNESDAQTALTDGDLDLNALRGMFQKLKSKLADYQKEYDGLRRKL